MKLYHKRLNNLDELRKEKRALKAELKKYEEEASLDKITTFQDDSLISKVVKYGWPVFKVFTSKTDKASILSISKQVLGSYFKWEVLEIIISTAIDILSSAKKKSDK